MYGLPLPWDVHRLIRDSTLRVVPMGVLMGRKKKKKVYGLEGILTELRKRRSRTVGDGFSQVKVGYKAPHAVPVHERLDMNHPNGGQAKFLEQPMRTEASKMAEIIRSRLRAREPLLSAQLAAAKHLIAVSIPLVPVDTGELVGSWFIEPIGRGVSPTHTGLIRIT